MLAPILHPATKTWTLGKIERHVARPMTLDEVELHVADYDRLQKLCHEQSTALQWAKELIETKDLLIKQQHEVPALSAEDEARRNRIIDLVKEQDYVRDGEVEIMSNAELSEGDDNGCYVSGYVWCPFAGTEFDKEKEDES